MVAIVAIVAVSVAVVGSGVVWGLAARTSVEGQVVRPTPRPSSEEESEPTWICSETDRLLDSAESEPVGDTAGIRPLKALTPTEIGAPFELLGNSRIPDARTIGDERGPVWLSELEEDGFLQGLIRAWRLPRRTVASVHLYEFSTHEGALAFQRFALEDQSCPYSYDIFEVKRVPGSIGLQIYWADGTESEQVSFVRGSRRYAANVRGPTIPERALVLRLTRRLSETAK